MALSVFHRTCLLTHITSEYVHDPYRADQFAPYEIDANTLVADYMDFAEYGRKSLNVEDDVTEEMKAHYAELHKNIFENRWEAVAFVEQIVALCNQGAS